MTELHVFPDDLEKIKTIPKERDPTRDIKSSGQISSNKLLRTGFPGMPPGFYAISTDFHATPPAAFIFTVVYK